MTTVKELKARKELSVTRIDNNYQPDEVIIKHFEKEVEENNYEVLSKKLNDDNYMEYELINNKEVEELKYYGMTSQKDIEDILSKINQPILSYKTDKEFLYVQVRGARRYFNLRLNKPYMKKSMQGKIIFRSKDYYFEFTDEDKTTHQLFNFDGLKASMLENNKIKTDYNIEYVIND